MKEIAKLLANQGLVTSQGSYDMADNFFAQFGDEDTAFVAYHSAPAGFEAFSVIFGDSVPMRFVLKAENALSIEAGAEMVARRQMDGRMVMYFTAPLYPKIGAFIIGGGGEPQIDPMWLYFTMPEGGTVTLTKNGSPTAVTLEYSLDNGGTWTEWLEAVNVRSLTLAAGQTMHLRNTSPTSTGFSTSSSNYYQFSFDADTYAGGDIMSIKCVDPSLATMTSYCFINLFKDCIKLITAADMSGITSISYYGCKSMYQGCTSLTAAADMGGVTSINYYGYESMYQGCTSLTAAADMGGVTSINVSACRSMYQGCTSLTAAADMGGVKSINQNGCESMYQGCTSLTAAADMSDVTSIAGSGCRSMYQGCTSLTAAPDMSGVTSIGNYGCYYMYQGCTILSVVRIGNPDISATSCLSSWLSGVAATGDFYCSASLTIPTGSSGIPSGWTRHDI